MIINKWNTVGHAKPVIVQQVWCKIGKEKETLGFIRNP